MGIEVAHHPHVQTTVRIVIVHFYFLGNNANFLSNRLRRKVRGLDKIQQYFQVLPEIAGGRVQVTGLGKGRKGIGIRP